MIVYYRPINNEVDIFKNALECLLPIMLKGPTGCGKTTFVESMASLHNRKLIQVACNEDTSATDLVGRYLLKGGETVWVDGPVTKAMREGAILYLDEVAEAREDVIVLIHPLTDHRREIYIDKLSESVKAHKDFMLIISFNPGYQRGLKELKPSTRQRFIGLSFNYPEESVEQEILNKVVVGSEAKFNLKLVKFANKIRSLHELGLTETISTRLLVNASRLVTHGLNARIALKTCLSEVLSDDLKVIESIDDLINLSF